MFWQYSTLFRIKGKPAAQYELYYYLRAEAGELDQP